MIEFFTFLIKYIIYIIIMSFSSYNKGVPLGSIYSQALTRPYNADSFLVRNQNVSFEPSIPTELSNKNYKITANSTVYIPNSTNGNVYINCGNFNTIRNEVNNLAASNANVIQRYFFTPNDKSHEFEYISKHLSPGETLGDTLPIRSQKFRIELINQDLTANAQVYINNTLLWFTQFNTHAHQQEIVNNPVNLNARLNNNFYDDAAMGNLKNYEYKNICGYMDHATGTSIQAFWNVDRQYFSSTAAFQPELVSTAINDNNLKIKLDGLDSNGEPLTEFINLNASDGTIPVQTSNAFLRINSASADIIQDVGNYDYSLNRGQVSVYVATSGVANGTQEFIDTNRTISNTVKYAVPRGKQVIIKDINLDGVVGNYEPEVDIYVNRNIIANTGENIFKRVFTSRFEDNQSISQHFTNLNIKIDELQEFYMEFNPNSAAKQNTFLTASVNYIEYPKKDFY